MHPIPSAQYILNNSFDIRKVNESQRTILDGTGSFSQFIISGPKCENIEQLVLAKLASQAKQTLVVINSIDEMMLICNQLAKVSVFASYIHGQLSTDEVKQRIDGFRAKDFRFLFITPDQASKDYILMSIMDSGHKTTVVVVNSEKFAKDHLHYSPVYDLLHLQLNSIQTELSKSRKEIFAFDRVYVGYALSKNQISGIVQRQRIHNVEYFISNYSTGLVLESICVKNTSAILRECENICSNTKNKCVVIVKDKKQSELFSNAMNKQNKTINVFDYPGDNGLEAIKIFHKLKSGILISNRLSHITESHADTVILCQLPLSVSHLCSLLGATSNQSNFINICHILYPEYSALNQATYELNSKFPTIKDHQKIIDYLKKLDNTKFDKNLVFKMSNEIPMAAKTVFRVLENLATMLFLSKQVFFNKGFQANFEILNLNRTLPKEIDLINLEVSKQLLELVEMLSTHGCKTDLLNKHIGVSTDAKCGKCSVCYHIKVGGRWKNRIPSLFNSVNNSHGPHNISIEKTHSMYRNPYQLLNNSNAEIAYESAKINVASSFNNQSIDLSNPLQSKLSLIRAKVAQRLKIPELSVFSNKTMHELIEKRPVSIRDLNSINEFYGSQRARMFGNEIVNVFRNER
tara:strand:- start:42959 stop:44857 length:1899 start_codon:yes stop_codon:yes gene_type:complete